MSKSKRFKFGIIQGSRQAHIKDCHTGKSATIDVYDDNIKYFVDLLNTQQATIKELKEELNDCEKFRFTVFKRIEEVNDELEREVKNRGLEWKVIKNDYIK